VVYGVLGDNLNWFRDPDWASGGAHWVNKGSAQLVGPGWKDVAGVFSAGNNVFYKITPWVPSPDGSKDSGCSFICLGWPTATPPAQGPTCGGAAFDPKTSACCGAPAHIVPKAFPNQADYCACSGSCVPPH
jgi:hypothetical protein